MRFRQLLRRHVALPSEHGAWVLLISPLLIGLFAGGRWSVGSSFLVVGCLSGFLIRQPITLAIKVYSGRRSREVLPAAAFWIAIYGAAGLLQVAGLVRLGFGYLLFLAIPGIPVLAWHLLLVARRSERRQWPVEIAAAGALALSAPAAFWIGRGHADPIGWWLWALSWAQSAASIVYAYLRLEQRVLERLPDWRTRLRMGQPAFFLALFNLALAVALGLRGTVPPLVFAPFALQWAETVWGVSRPAVGFKPRAIGFRQLAVSTLFTVLFILAWRS